MKLSDLASRLGVALEGDGAVEIERAASLEDAGPGDLSFVRDPKHAGPLATTRAAALVLPPGLHAAAPVLRTAHPDATFLAAVELLHPRPAPPRGVHPTALVAPSARVAPDASVGPYVVIEADVVVGARTEVGAHVVLHRGVVLGDDVRVHSRVVVREGCRIGHRVVIQDGAVIGADGFGFVRRPDGSFAKVPQVGIVVLEDDVEVQANACVDRATLGATRILRGTKIDNLVQVGHNCVVGPDTILCGQVGIAGSTVVGRGVMLGGQVGVAGHCTIGDGAGVLAKSGVTSDVEPKAVLAGTPTMPVRLHHRFHHSIPRLVELPGELKRLEARVAALERPGPA